MKTIEFSRTGKIVMAYDKEGKWINPKSIKNQKCRDNVLDDTIKTMTTDEILLLLYTIQSKEKITEQQELLRWYYLRMTVRRAYKRRWGRYYSSGSWHKAPLDNYIINNTDFTRTALRHYDEVQRILDLWNIIEHHKYRISPQVTIKSALKKYYLNSGDLETINLFKYGYGVSFTVGRKKNNYIEEEIPYAFALKSERYIYNSAFDFSATFQTMFTDDARKYDEWLKGDRTTPNPRMYKPSAAKAVTLYANLWRHFLLRQYGSNLSLDQHYETYFDGVKVEEDTEEDAFGVLNDHAKYYAKLRGIANHLRNVKTIDDDKHDVDLQKVLNEVYSTRTILPSTKERIIEHRSRTNRSYGRKSK